MSLFYIASPYAPCGNCVMWWADGGHGYTVDLAEAWRVDKEEAERIVRMRRGDAAYPVEAIHARARMHFDAQLLDEIEELSCTKLMEVR